MQGRHAEGVALVYPCSTGWLWQDLLLVMGVVPVLTTTVGERDEAPKAREEDSAELAEGIKGLRRSYGNAQRQL
jgi:hypothetical protein